MSELGVLRNLGIEIFKGTWMKVYTVLLTLNAVIYLLAQAAYPGNLFTVPVVAQPFVIALYALWWLAVVWLINAVIALTKNWRWRRAIGLSIVWVVGLWIGTAVCPANQELITASIMSFGIGSSLGWSGAAVLVSLLGLW